MPGRQRAFYGRNRIRPTINSEKHALHRTGGVTTSKLATIIAKAVTAPSNTVDTDCHRGGHIKSIWCSIDFCGLGASGAILNIMVYLMKNPGANLTGPGGFAIGTSNEKKFVVKTWSAMAMRNQDGNNPYHWEGWVKVPKLYQRMGTDDTWELVVGSDAGTGHFTYYVIYKEYF